MTLLVATHEMNFARDFADQVCFLSDGRILEQGPPEQIFTAPRHDDTRRFLARLLSKPAGVTVGLASSTDGWPPAGLHVRGSGDCGEASLGSVGAQRESR